MTGGQSSVSRSEKVRILLFSGLLKLHKALALILDSDTKTFAFAFILLYHNIKPDSATKTDV